MNNKGFIYGIVWLVSIMIMACSSQPIFQGDIQLTRVNVVICIIGLGFGIWSQMKVLK